MKTLCLIFVWGVRVGFGLLLLGLACLLASETGLVDALKGTGVALGAIFLVALFTTIYEAAKNRIQK